MQILVLTYNILLHRDVNISPRKLLIGGGVPDGFYLKSFYKKLRPDLEWS
jgi:hypothetical protein